MGKFFIIFFHLFFSNLMKKNNIHTLFKTEKKQHKARVSNGPDMLT